MIDNEIFCQLLASEEGPTLEFKLKYVFSGQGNSKTRDEVAKDIIALANTGRCSGANAYLILGAGDCLRPDGTRDKADVRPSNYTRKLFLQIVNAACSPPLNDLEYCEVDLDGNSYGVVCIRPSPFVHKLTRNLDTPKGLWRKDSVLIRRADEVGVADPSEIQLLLSRNLHRDRRVADISPLIESYRALLADRVRRVYVSGELRDLERAFVTLKIVERYRHPSTQIEYVGLMDAEMRRRRSERYIHKYRRYNLEQEEEPASESLGKTIDSEEVLTRHTNTVVTGPPGGGKTTLLKYLVLRVLKQNVYVPVLLELKNVREEDLRRLRGDLAEVLFNKAVVETLHPSAEDRHSLKEWFFSYLSRGEVVVFLDGLDEVSGEGFFPRLRESITSFINSAYRNNLLIISTRPYALQGHFEGFEEMEIAPFDYPQIREFLNHYYSDELRVIQFMQALRSRSHLIELARVPMLLGVMVQIFQTHGRLMNTRLQLYRNIVWQLAVQRDREKSLRRADFQVPDPDGVLKLDFLRQLAYERLLVDCSDREAERDASRFVFTGDAILDKAKQFLHRAKRDEISPYLLASDVRATSLLREIGPNAFAFSHLTIQEYLAAEALSKQPDSLRIFCQAYFTPILAEMEVLPMTLGLVSDPDEFYHALDELPESLDFACLRLRARGLAYASTVSSRTVRYLSDCLVDVIAEAAESPYLEGIARSFSGIAGGYEQHILDRLKGLLLSENTNFKTVWAVSRAIEHIASDETIANLVADLEVHHGNADNLADRRHFAIEQLIYTLRSRSRWDHLDLDSGARGSSRPTGKEFAQRLNSDSKSARLKAVSLSAQKEILISALTAREAEVRAKAAGLLGGTRHPDVIDAMISALNDPDASVRFQVIKALGRIGGDRALDHLIGALGDSDQYVVGGVVLSLGYLGGERAIAALKETFDSNQSYVRWRTVEALGKIGGLEVESILKEALDDPDNDVRWRAAEVLGKKGGTKGLARLRLALLSEHRFVRLRAVAALARTGKGRAFAEVLRALKSSHEDVRAAAVDRLPELGGAEAVPALINSLTEDSANVQSSAALALENVTNLCEGLMMSLSSEKESVRLKAAQVIAYYGSGQKTLEKLNQLAMSDPNGAVRLAAEKGKEKFESKLQLNWASRTERSEQPSK